MVNLDTTVGNGPARVSVKGINRVVRQLAKAGVDAEDQKDLMHEIGQIVVNASLTPVLSGRLASTVRAGRGKTKAVVRAGGARAPYAGRRHYGDPHNAYPGDNFLVSALQRKRNEVLSRLETGIDDLLKKNDLK